MTRKARNGETEERAGDPPLPGDPSPAERIARMIRVDHAGEYGAARIYAGQLAVLDPGPRRRRARGVTAIRRMAEQEQRHLESFERLIVEREVRPTVMQPLWHVAGFAMGAATALLGERAAMACTVAVEEVIDAHYAAQAEALGSAEPELRALIEEYRADEQAHRDTALDHEAEKAPAYPLLSAAIKSGSRLAIWLSTRL